MASRPHRMQRDTTAHQRFRHYGKSKTHSGKSGVFGKTADFYRTRIRSFAFIYGMRYLFLCNIRFISRIIDDHSPFFIGIIYPLLQFCPGNSRSGRIVWKAQVYQIRCLLRKLRHKSVFPCTRHIDHIAPHLRILVINPASVRTDQEHGKTRCQIFIQLSIHHIRQPAGTDNNAAVQIIRRPQRLCTAAADRIYRISVFQQNTTHAFRMFHVRKNYYDIHTDRRLYSIQIMIDFPVCYRPAKLFPLLFFCLHIFMADMRAKCIGDQRVLLHFIQRFHEITRQQLRTGLFQLLLMHLIKIAAYGLRRHRLIADSFQTGSQTQRQQ